MGLYSEGIYARIYDIGQKSKPRCATESCWSVGLKLGVDIQSTVPGMRLSRKTDFAMQEVQFVKARGMIKTGGAYFECSKTTFNLHLPCGSFGK